MKQLFLIALFLYPPIIFADVRFIPHIIENTELNPAIITFSDFDNDGNMDILGGCHGKKNSIMWFKNKGNGEFEQANIVDRCYAPLMWLSTADIDKDNNQDIIAATQSGYEAHPVIAWYQNEGHGAFSSAMPIRAEGVSGNTAFAEDIDNDGFFDVIYVTGYPHEVAWHKNTDGAGTFGPPKIIYKDDDNDYQPAIRPVDIDDDDDMDIIIALSKRDKIMLFKNNGDGTFDTPQTITSNVQSPICVYATDIDGDNDVDIVSGAGGDGKIAWYPNTGGQFSTQKIIATSAGFWLHAADLDSDGDFDVLVSGNEKVSYYENLDGKGSFSSAKIIADNSWAPSISSVDIDNDGDIDVLATFPNDQKIVWYENLINTASVRVKLCRLPETCQLHQNYPNPFNPSTNIRFNLTQSENVQLKIYNIHGQEIQTLVDAILSAGEHSIHWHAEGLPAGIYLARLQAESEVKTMKLILQK